MRELSIDIETFSEVDLKKHGVYQYAEHHSFEILLFSYAFDDDEVQCVDLARGENIPHNIVLALVDPDVIKTAHNAAFEFVCINQWLQKKHGHFLVLSQWVCSMIKCAMLGLPMSLDSVCTALRIQAAKYKDGGALIRIFCVPCKPTEKNGYRTRNLPAHEPEKWARFKVYNIRDVEAEQEIKKRVAWFTIPPQEQKLWELDQRINARGVYIDQNLARAAITVNDAHQENMIAEAVALTGLANPRSVAQIKNWLIKEVIEEDEDETFIEGDTLTKDDLPKLIKKFDSEKIRRVLEIRKETSKSSIKKYVAMLEMAGRGSRARGLFQFCGANRTWRWSGRRIQPQNLARNTMKALAPAREMMLLGDADIMYMLFESVSTTLSQLVRTGFTATPGNRLLVSDFSSIEARVLAWLAGEQWVLEVFAGHGKIYEATASQMFKIPIESIGKDSPFRQRGKVATLACGYGGAVGALIRMKAHEGDNAIPIDELAAVVAQYRAANPNIVAYWRELQDAAIQVITEGGVVRLNRGVSMYMHKNCLMIDLPSGRTLVYCGAQYGYNPEVSKYELTYWGVNQTTKKWEMIRTYGGKLAENITQAIARDLLAEAMIHIDAAGYPIVLHVHDEVVADCPKNFGSIEELNKLMCTPVKWAKGLPIAAAGFETFYYKKD